MARPQTRTDDLAELALPTTALIELRRALSADAGADAAARALQRAGYVVGDSFFQLLASHASKGHRSRAGDGEHLLAQMAAPVYWRRLADLFAAHGWGHVAFTQVHPGIGALESADWAEADPEGRDDRPSCFFTTGLLANLLGRTAGVTAGVLEVECRSRGDERCRFFFGGNAALERLYGELAAGRDVAGALAALS